MDEKVINNSSGDIDFDPPRIILKPKLRAPPPRPEQMDRPRLLELLRGFTDCKITIVSAPAGYGKTTLLAQWRQAEEASLPFAWISLDEQDNDPIRLWRHVVEALRQITAREDFGAETLVRMSVAGQKLVDVSLPMFVNELAELPRQIVVVLDDYQFITEDDSHESVAFFVEHLPSNVHVVLSTRSDPPLPLGRWRARGELHEIRTEQLAFSEAEATYLLNEEMGLDIGSHDIAKLLERTEGWPAGTYLAALSLQGSEDKHAFIETFTGSNRYIVDLLAEEILKGLPEEVREFLLKTSVVRRMTGPLCDAIVGREGSGKLLRELARANLFVVPLDEQGEWYRYHHLFSDFLIYEIRSSRPDLVPVLHSRASVWLEGNGFAEGAIRHALAAADYEGAGMLIASSWSGYVFAGQTVTVERWLEALPEALATGDAALLLVSAWCRALSGQCEQAEKLLALAESLPYEGPLPDGTASVEAGGATVRAVFGLGGVQSTLEAARHIVTLEPERPSLPSALVHFGLGVGSYLSGETSQARKQFEEALKLTTAGLPLVRVASLSFLSLVAADEGHLKEAESNGSEAQALVDRYRLQGIPQASLLPISLGYVLAKQGNLAEAQTELEKGLSARSEWPGLSPWPVIIGLLALAPVLSARGDRAGARSALAEARTLLEPFADDAGIFPELLERQERKLRARRSRDASLNGELTERELEVLGLLAGDLSTRQMAHSIYVAPSTVRTQVKSIYRKLGVSSRQEAVEEARVRGLL